MCPLPQVQLAEGELDEALEPVWRAEHPLTSVFREREPGKPERVAQGYEYEVPMSVEVDGVRREWSERRLVVRSLRHAQAAEAGLRARMAKATAQIEALNLRGRGRTRFEEIETVRQAVNEIVQRYRVEDFLWLRYAHHTTLRLVRASKELWWHAG